MCSLVDKADSDSEHEESANSKTYLLPTQQQISLQLALFKVKTQE